MDTTKKFDGYADDNTQGRPSYAMGLIDCFYEKFRDECSRIIKNDGRVALIWNVRDESDPINKDLRNVYEKYCPNFKGFAGGIVKDDQRVKDFFNNQYDSVAYIGCVK